MHNSKKKVVLAFSGGLDTTVILKWLQETHGCEVITYTADLGGNENAQLCREKALNGGAKEVYIEDLREEFVSNYIFPMIRANAVYEGDYLLGSAISRPLIAKRLVEIAHQTKSDAICHGATGKGNDQLRFEWGAYALDPSIEIICPWRSWHFTGRKDLLNYAKKNTLIEDTLFHNSTAPLSMDSNIFHTSYEGNELEDLKITPHESMWKNTNNLKNTPDTAEEVLIEFLYGNPIKINGQNLAPHTLLDSLNQIGTRHGIGRVDIVENRALGIKSRGCYETPGGTILLKAHKALEAITLDREVAHLKEDLMPRYARLLYNGLWWSPERKALQTLFDHTQENVEGLVKIKAYKGNIEIISRESSQSLYNQGISSFETKTKLIFPQDATGFIQTNALRLRLAKNHM